jgi:hypothetical protein
MKIFKRGSLLWLPFLFSLSIHAIGENHQVYNDQQWLNIMRYRKTFFGYTSEVDSKEYFLALDGKKNPKSELEASLIFLENKINRCQFPSRYLYLYKKGLLKEKESFSHCKDFNKFKKKVDIDSVSVVFSSYYIDRPASAFGHTLLKINTKGSTSDLKDYGVDFSARVTTDNPILYGVMGITGGFLGNFNLMPYFLKLREYNDYDSRDLWEFKLDLSTSEKELFIAHLWDMNRAKFDYYYLSENCSYHVLGFIDAIVPRFKLMKTMGSFITPSDTIVPLFSDNKKLIKEVFLRPSLISRLRDQLNTLSSSEKSIVMKGFDGENIEEDIKDLSLEKKARILDTTIDFIDYKYSDEIFLKEGSKSAAINKVKQKILILRSQNPFHIKSKKKIKKERLNIAHSSGKIILGFESSHKDINDRIILGSRFALHEYREPTGDLYGNFTLRMGRMEAAYLTKSKKAKLRLFEIANVVAIRPFDFINKKFSWNFSVGLKNDDILKRDLGGHLDLGLGYAKTFEKVLLALYIQNTVHKEIKGLDRLSLDTGPKLVFGFRPLERLYLESSVHYIKNIRTGGDFEGLGNFKGHYYFEKFGFIAEASLYKSETRFKSLISYFY